MNQNRFRPALALATTLLALAISGATRANAQSITITYPTGGETWVAGETYTVTWTAQQVASVSIYLMRDDEIYERLGGGTNFPNNGSLEYTICDLIGNGANYTVRVYASSLSGPITDDSDAPFTITGSPRPTFQVISPNGGEACAAGSQQTIAWTSTNPVGDVAVWLDYAGEPQALLGIVPMDTGSLPWLVGALLGDGNDYAIRLTWSAPCGTVDMASSAAPFSITASPPQPTLTLTRPNANESWLADTTEAITWTATDPAGEVEIWLTDAEGRYTPLGTAPMAASQFDWPILPCVENRTDYQILLRARRDGPPLEDLSDAAFSIAGAFEPTFSITSPATGVTWPAGSQQLVTWTSNASSGELDVTLDGVYLGHAPVADGQLPVSIPFALGDGAHTITVRLTACGGYGNSATSGSFTITGSITPTLTLTSPVGGEIWTAGTPQAITWNSTGLTGYLDIYLPSDGNYHSNHAVVPVEDGVFFWPIPATLVWPPPGSPYHPGGVMIISRDCGTTLRRSSGNIDIIAGSPFLGDLDADGDIDVIDLTTLQLADTGDWPIVALGPVSAAFDLEPDGDVDFDDADPIWDNVTGPALDDVQEVR